jgi:predicted Rossmann-fold nucleotide-binding protein
VFGASWCAPGTPLYEESERLGAALAEAGFGIANGGYFGGSA